MAKLPKFDALDAHYPDYVNFPLPDAVKKLVGGAANEAWITNTCAMRMSRTLNYNGIPIPAAFPGLNTVAGADRKRYAFRVRELHAWLAVALGKPDFDRRKRQGDSFDPKAALGGMTGIIGFDIHFTDATGHFDLWDGSDFTESKAGLASVDYWTTATRIWLWKAAT